MSAAHQSEYRIILQGNTESHCSLIAGTVLIFSIIHNVRIVLPPLSVRGRQSSTRLISGVGRIIMKNVKES